MFRTVLIANRGEIASRIGRTLRAMGIRVVAVYSDADRFTRGVLEADEAHRLGPAPAAQSYLDVEAVIAAAKASGAEAVHPGYGFLSENVAFAERLAQEGIAFIGPKPEHLRAFGLKHTARELAQASGVPLLPEPASSTAWRRRWRRPKPFPIPSCSRARRAAAASGCSSAPMRRSWPPPSSACSARLAPPSAMPASIWSASWRRPAMWRCRSSATGRAASWHWASATARSSAATRRSSRRRPPRCCRMRCARACTPLPWRWARASAMPPPARWSSSMIRRGRSSISWR